MNMKEKEEVGRQKTIIKQYYIFVIQNILSKLVMEKSIILFLAINIYGRIDRNVRGLGVYELSIMKEIVFIPEMR